jgi:hypothetical protein
VEPGAWRDRQERCRRVGLGGRIRDWFVKNGGSNRISEVWGCHVRVLSLYCCDPLRQAELE